MTNSTCSDCHALPFRIKSGLNDIGSQRYRYKSCRRYFTPQPKPASYEQGQHGFALKLHLECTSFPVIGRLLHLNHQTKALWINAEADQLPQQAIDQQPGPDIEMDEG